MTEREMDKKLTPAAKSALNELVENYREQILVGAKSSALEVTGETDAITVKDIINGVETSKSRLDRRSARRIMFFRVMMATGLLYTIVGIAFFIYRNFKLELTEQMGLIIAFTGLTISLVSYFSLSLSKGKYQLGFGGEGSGRMGYSEKSMELLLIKKWTDIELAARDLLASRVGESRADMSISHIIEFLTKKGIFHEAEHKQARRLLEMRNQILHRGKTFSSRDIDEANSIANKLLERIRS